jgi:hypothetical protein
VPAKVAVPATVRVRVSHGDTTEGGQGLELEVEVLQQRVRSLQVEAASVEERGAGLEARLSGAEQEKAEALDLANQAGWWWGGVTMHRAGLRGA